MATFLDSDLGCGFLGYGPLYACYSGADYFGGSGNGIPLLFNAWYTS